MQNVAKKKQITLTRGNGNEESHIVEWYVNFLIIIPQGLI